MGSGEQLNEIGSDRYFDGLVQPRQAALHPGKFHIGLLERVRAAGVALVTQCRVRNITTGNQHLRIGTDKGTVEARDVVIGTNGYTGVAFPWQRRRIIPIASYIIASEEIPAQFADELVPAGRTLSDTRRVVFYYRSLARPQTHAVRRPCVLRRDQSRGERPTFTR